MQRYLIFCLLSLVVGVASAAAAEFTWKQTPSSLALLDAGKIVWQFHCEKGEHKPYFHPLTVAGSPPLTDLRPADHPWHLGLWFSWKFINGLNYWEEDRKTHKAAGSTEVLDAAAAARPDHSARLQMKLAYHPSGQDPVLTEARTIEVSPPDATGGWHIDWRGTFTAGKDDVHLDRTPILGEPNGVSYGGYAGLSLRLSRALRSWQFADEGGPVAGARVRTHSPSRWMSFGGALPDGKVATILILEHPHSFRHPANWYLIGEMPFFSPTILYASPYTLPAGKTIDLRYRIILLPGRLDAKASDAAWKRYAGEAQ